MVPRPSKVEMRTVEQFLVVFDAMHRTVERYKQLTGSLANTHTRGRQGIATQVFFLREGAFHYCNEHIMNERVVRQWTLVI